MAKTGENAFFAKNALEKTWIVGRIECRRRKQREGKMVGWHHQLDGHELEQSSRSW